MTVTEVLRNSYQDRVQADLIKIVGDEDLDELAELTSSSSPKLAGRSSTD